MKQLSLIVFLLFLITGRNHALAQSDIPNTQLEGIDGESLSTEEIFGSEQPVLLVFWATWCSHTLDGLTVIQEDYFYDWQEDFNLKVVAVSTDDSKTANSVPMVANGKGWDFDIFYDINGDFRREMGVNNAPYIFLINANGEIVWQQNAYIAGDEELIEQELSQL